MRNSIRKTLIGAASFVFVCAIGATGLISTSATAETPVLAGTNTNVLTEEIADNALTGFQVYGASVRQNDPAGIRFLTVLTESDLAQIPSENVTFGTLLLPQDMLAENELLTMETSDVLVAQATTPCTDKEVPANGLGYFVTLVGNGLTSFPESLYDEDFAARSYVKYTYEKDGETVEDVVYSTQESRSMTYVASAELYKNPDTNPDSLLNKIVATKANVNLAINDNEPTIGFQTGEKATVEVSGNEGLKYKLTSSNEAVAKVDQDGTLTAVGPGEATITASIGAISASESLNVHASLDTLKEGVTYDWTNTSMPITSSTGSKCGTIVAVEDIENADAKAAIQGASEGFTTNVNHVTGNNQHNLLGLYREYGNLQVGYAYTVELYYYAVSASSDYIIALGDNANDTLQSDPFKTGLNKLTFTYNHKDAAKFVLTFWSSSTDIDVYFGNMTITAEVIPYYDVTDEDVAKAGGYTYDFSEGNLLQMENNATYLPYAELPEAAKNTGAFNANGYGLKIAGISSCYLVPLQGKLVANADYTISFTAYEVTKGSFTILLMNSTKAQAGRSNFTLTDNGNGTVTYTTTFTATADYAYINPYIITQCELYLANFTISRSAALQTTTYSKTAASLNGGNKGTIVTTPAAVAGKAGFGDQAVHFVDGSSTSNAWVELFNMKDEVGVTGFVKVEITIYYYVETKSSTGLYFKYAGSNFAPLDTSVGYHAVTVTITQYLDWLTIHAPSHAYGSLYIGQIDYTVYTA